MSYMFGAALFAALCFSLPEAAAAISPRREVNLGTTIVALRSKQGLVVGADTRTSQSTMVSNRYANKISVLYEKGPVSCVLCRSGSAADTQFLEQRAKWEFRSRALRYGMEEPSLHEIARWLRYVVSNGDYSASLLCVGYDPNDGRRGRIYSISKTGALLEEELYAAAGSGSTYIIGLMDSWIKQQSHQGELMEEKEAIEFVSHLVHRAMARDQASGGAVRIVVLNDQGSKRLTVNLPYSSSIALEDAAADNTTPRDLKGFKPAARSL